MATTLSFTEMRSVVLTFALLASLAQAQSPDSEQLLRTAIDAQQSGNYEVAIRDYRRVLELRPSSFEAKVNLGASLVHVGQFDAAIAEYKSALLSAPRNYAVVMNLGLAYYKKGDFKNAREQFEIVHRAEPDEVRVAILLGDSELHLNDVGSATALLAPLEASNSDNLDFVFVDGSALIKSGQRREGVAQLEKVGLMGPSADAYMLAGSTLLVMNEFERARQDIDAALRLDPKLPGIYTLAGTARDKAGDVKEAEVAFRAALALNPDDFEANLYLGAILYKRRELDAARIFLAKANQLNPTSSMARYEYAMLKSKSGEYEAATHDLESVVKTDPGWLEPHVELAALYYRLHRPAEGARERQIVEKLTEGQQVKGPDIPDRD